MKYKFQILASAVLWSTSFTVIKTALKYLSPLELAFLRFLSASVIANLVLIFRRKSFPSPNPIFLLLGFLNAFGFYLQFAGQVFTPASKAALIVNLYVVFAPALAFMFLRERFTLSKGLSIGLAVLGIFSISTHFNLNYLRSGHIKGDLLILGASIVWSVFIILTKIASAEIEGLEASVMLMNLTLFSFSVPYLIIHGNPFHIPLRALPYALYLGVFGSFIPYTLYISGLRKLDVSTSSIFLVIEIALAVLWAWMFLGEKLSWLDFIGAFLIILAILLQNNNKGEG